MYVCYFIVLVLEASIKGKKKRKYFFYGKELPRSNMQFIWFFESLHDRERSKTEKIIIEKIISELKNPNSNQDVKIETYVIIPNKL